MNPLGRVARFLIRPFRKVSHLKSRSGKLKNTVSNTNALMPLHLWMRDIPPKNNWRHVTREFSPTDTLNDVHEWLKNQFPHLLFEEDLCLYSPLNGVKYFNTGESLQQSGIKETTIFLVVSESKAEMAGKVGFSNRANQCYMNASLQCLLHTPELIRYFLSEKHLVDVNEKNPAGLNGQFAEVFRELMMHSWMALENPLSNEKFESKLALSADAFADDAQHDAIELIETVLDTLMEDCNRVYGKEPPIYKIETEGVSTRDLPDLYWKQHQSRSGSFITDVFHGQHKMKTGCTECGYKHRSFDAFTVLHAGIPPRKRLIAFTLIEVCGEKGARKYAMEIPSDQCMDDLYWETAKLLKIEVETASRRLYFTQLKGGRPKFFEMDDPIKNIEDDCDLFLFYYPDDLYGPATTHGNQVYMVHEFGIISQNHTAFSPKIKRSRDVVASYPLVVWLSNEEISHLCIYAGGHETNNPIVEILAQFIRPLKRERARKSSKRDPPIVEGYHLPSMSVPRELRLRIPESDANLKVDCHPLPSSSSRGDVDADEEVGSYLTAHSATGSPIEIDESLNLLDEDMQHADDPSSPANQVLLSPATRAAAQRFQQEHRHTPEEFLDSDALQHTAAEFAASSKTTTIIKPLYVSKACPSRRYPKLEHVYTIKWKSDAMESSILKSFQNVPEDRSANAVDEKRSALKRTNIQLRDCLQHEFDDYRCGRRGESLWRCSNCSKLVNATKTMKLIRSPTVLLIGLKRFHFDEKQNQIHKIQEHVVYPAKGLNLNRHCNKEPGSDDCVYDLYGVCRHTGDSPTSGHYTSCVKTTDGTWWLFDDALVKRIAESEVKRFDDAYLLFYRKRDAVMPAAEIAPPAAQTVSSAVQDRPVKVVGRSRRTATAPLPTPVVRVKSPKAPEESVIHTKAPKAEQMMTRSKTFAAGHKDSAGGKRRTSASIDSHLSGAALANAATARKFVGVDKNGGKKVSGSYVGSKGVRHVEPTLKPLGAMKAFTIQPSQHQPPSYNGQAFNFEETANPYQSEQEKMDPSKFIGWSIKNNSRPGRPEASRSHRSSNSFGDGLSGYNRPTSDFAFSHHHRNGSLGIPGVFTSANTTMHPHGHLSMRGWSKPSRTRTSSSIQGGINRFPDLPVVDFAHVQPSFETAPGTGDRSAFENDTNSDIRSYTQSSSSRMDWQSQGDSYRDVNSTQTVKNRSKTGRAHTHSHF